MKYILNMVVDESDWQSLTPEQMQPMIDEMERYNSRLRDAGVWVSGEALDFSSNAKTVRVENGNRTVVDGPSSSEQLQIGGFWIIDVKGLDDALEWARQVPLTNGAIEVRALLDEDGAAGA